MKDIIVIESELVKTSINPAEVFVTGGLDNLYREIEKKAKAGVEGLPVETDKGRKAFGAVCRKISSTKVFVESGMKQYVADLKAKIKPVDAERIRFVALLDDLRDEIDKPRQEYLQREQAVIDAANAVMKRLTDAVVVYAGTTSDELGRRVAEIEGIDTDNLPEDYKERAVAQKNSTLTILYQQHESTQKREADQAELEAARKLLAEQAEKKRQEEAAAAQAAREKKIAEEAAEKAKAEAEKREQTAIKAREEAEAAARRAEERRAEEARAAEIAKEQAIHDALQKAKEEAARAEAVKQAEFEKQRQEEEKRQASKKHRTKVKDEAVRFIQGIHGTTQEQAEGIFDAISNGEVPHVNVIW